MSLVKLAGANGLSASFCASIAPGLASRIIYDCALTLGGGGSNSCFCAKSESGDASEKLAKLSKYMMILKVLLMFNETQLY